jgi:hypothetical protein
MIKGLAITPPTIGRISIGKVVERNGKRLPVKDDQFTITTQLQTMDGDWLVHPVDEGLRQAQGGKVRTIPVRLLFNDPDLNLRADFTMFDRASGRPMCVGNGEVCKRMGSQGVESLPCPGPDQCPLAEGGRCKPYGRLNVVIGEDDALGTFVFRTTGYNSLRTLSARLAYFQAVSGGNLACLPLELKLRGKTTAQSFGTPIFYADLVVRGGLSLGEALTQATSLRSERQASGYDQAALDQAAKEGFTQGAFEDSIEEGGTVMEEFYAGEEPGTIEATPGQRNGRAGTAAPSLSSKLSEKAAALQGEPT